MNLLKTIFFIFFGLMLTSCGNKENKEEKAEKTEDGRIILSLTAVDTTTKENTLVIPDGRCTGCIINKTKLGRLIEEKFDVIAWVYGISMSDKSFPQESLYGGAFLTSFVVKTVSGEVYTNIQCRSRITVIVKEVLELHDCESKEVVLEQTLIIIPFAEILLDDSSRSKLMVK